MEESLYAFGTPKNKTQKLCIKFRAGLCWAYKLCMMRRLAANGVQCADSHLKTTTKRAKPKYRATASNKLTIFTWNIKTLVNFQRKCVPAICTKGEGWFGPMPFFLALSLCFYLAVKISGSVQRANDFYWYYVLLHFSKLNCLQGIICSFQWCSHSLTLEHLFSACVKIAVRKVHTLSWWLVHIDKIAHSIKWSTCYARLHAASMNIQSMG